MGKLIDADALIMSMSGDTDALSRYCKWLLNNAPEAVVRCKDCKNSEYDFMCNCYWCKGRVVEADGYCSEGKRK